MRGKPVHQLHLVGLAANHRDLVFADEPDAATGTHVVRIDDALLAALAVAERDGRASGDVGRAGDGLSPPSRTGRARPSQGGPGKRAAKLFDLEPDERAAKPFDVEPDERAAKPEPAPDRWRTAGAAPAGGRGEEPSLSPARVVKHNEALVSGLSPREIQARLRSGRSVSDVASEAQVEEAWVERFAAPIVAEQQAAVARAGSLTYQAARRGASARPLGDSVRRNLLRRRVRLSPEEADAGWSAFQYHGNEWVVRFSYQSRTRAYTAEWVVDLGARSVLAMDRLAASLAYLRPADVGEGEAPAPAPAGDPTPPSVAIPTRARRATKRRVPSKRRAVPRKSPGGEVGPAPARGAKKAPAVKKTRVASKAPASGAKKAPAVEKTRVASKAPASGAKKAPAVEKTRAAKKASARAAKASAKKAATGTRASRRAANEAGTAQPRGAKRRGASR